MGVALLSSAQVSAPEVTVSHNEIAQLLSIVAGATIVLIGLWIRERIADARFNRAHRARFDAVDVSTFEEGYWDAR